MNDFVSKPMQLATLQAALDRVPAAGLPSPDTIEARRAG
jgi:hypothetical protein